MAVSSIRKHDYEWTGEAIKPSTKNGLRCERAWSGSRHLGQAQGIWDAEDQKLHRHSDPLKPGPITVTPPPVHPLAAHCRGGARLIRVPSQKVACSQLRGKDFEWSPDGFILPSRKLGLSCWSEVETMKSSGLRTKAATKVLVLEGPVEDSGLRVFAGVRARRVQEDQREGLRMVCTRMDPSIKAKRTVMLVRGGGHDLERAAAESRDEGVGPEGAGEG